MRKIFAVLAALICCLSVWTSVPAAQAFTLDKEDGEYSIQVELEGGSGKASVTSPTLITVKNGEVTADIQWSSSNYDYMIVDGKKYLPVNEEGTNSEFQIPVTIMDESMPVIADTTAMCCTCYYRRRWDSELFRKQEKPMLNQADTCISIRLRNTKKLPYGSFFVFYIFIQPSPLPAHSLQDPAVQDPDQGQQMRYPDNRCAPIK